MPPGQTHQGMRCSFCYKPQGQVGKLISSAHGGPRAYICDECIAVCVSIIEDDKRESETDGEPLREEGHFINHALVTEFLTAAECWAIRDLRGLPASDELNRMRALAANMLAQTNSSEGQC